MAVALYWIRRDLRLADNDALHAALDYADQVIPVYILDPVLLERYAGTKRVAFLFGAMRQLDAGLRTRGSQLVVRRGDAVETLGSLVQETGATAIFAQEDWTPYARQRDAKVAANLPLRFVGSPTLRPPGTVLKRDGRPYTVFTPFSREWKAFAPPSAGELRPIPSQIQTPEVSSLSLPTEPAIPPGMPFPASEGEAQNRLRAFAEGADAPIYRYARERDRLDLDVTSRLSPYLRFGLLSARQAVLAAYSALAAAPDEDAAKGAQTWLNELIWREFYVSILYHFPHVLERSFRPPLQDIPWENDEDNFRAWCEGQTGYPVVDAAMRQLSETGWMHNRARMIVASFLVKDLLIDWRWGERHFMQHLVDGDPAANNGGWQWTAGTGTDAAPYFRIFNPVLQGKRHDPHGTYVRRWVPELAGVPERHIHAPWEMNAETQRACNYAIGTDYPAPIIDHRQARERTLDAYRSAREGKDY
jgi:deoxyribodipyrimidine photo-lyase